MGGAEKSAGAGDRFACPQWQCGSHPSPLPVSAGRRLQWRRQYRPGRELYLQSSEAIALLVSVDRFVHRPEKRKYLVQQADMERLENMSGRSCHPHLAARGQNLVIARNEPADPG